MAAGHGLGAGCWSWPEPRLGPSSGAGVHPGTGVQGVDMGEQIGSGSARSRFAVTSLCSLE